MTLLSEMLIILACALIMAGAWALLNIVVYMAEQYLKDKEDDKWIRRHLK